MKSMSAEGRGQRLTAWRRFMRIEIDEAAGDRHVGQIRDPELIGALDNQILRQVLEDGLSSLLSVVTT
jgi:hypothetical protein